MMSTEWQLQEAKNRLSQLVNQATQDGPQIITVRGKPAAILLSIAEYQRLIQPRTKLTDFFQESPLCDVELDLERSADLSREVEL
jgi:prevent-host-death family protein